MPHKLRSPCKRTSALSRVPSFAHPFCPVSLSSSSSRVICDLGKLRGTKAKFAFHRHEAVVFADDSRKVRRAGSPPST